MGLGSGMERRGERKGSANIGLFLLSHCRWNRTGYVNVLNCTFSIHDGLCPQTVSQSTLPFSSPLAFYDNNKKVTNTLG